MPGLNHKTEFPIRMYSLTFERNLFINEQQVFPLSQFYFCYDSTAWESVLETAVFNMLLRPFL